ncbi:MAG: TatD family nuclease-associated radical SAM protein [Clostridiales bacterium]|nr:TatD family nuclease-associated radical SAM protein [Clostridiales bacterium]
MKDTYLYQHKNALYINLTNQCTNNCDFCIRHNADGIDGYDLWLKKEPKTTDVIHELKKYKISKFNEIVFCGYGEPMMKLDVLIEVSHYIKKHYPDTQIRINTNGQANLYYREDITTKLHGLIDVINISLNAPSADEYDEICHSDFSTRAYEGLLEFAQLAKKHVPMIRLSVVDVIGEVKVRQCQKIADDNQIELHVRKLI